MSLPVIESVRTIPLIIEKGNMQNHIPMDIDINSGFPFDRNPDRDDGHFRSQLDDIAKRHPELAEHLGTFSRRRQSSGGDAEDSSTRQRRFERPFASGRFDRFGFPFDREDFDPEQYAEQFYQQQPEFQHPQQEQSYQYRQPPPSNYQHQTSYPPQQEYQQPQQAQQQNQPSENTENSNPDGFRNIQQSSTVDLGQRQEPVNERNQRSMSAPPSEKPQRFTSSVKIPVNQPSNEGENMAQTQSQQQTDGKTTERIIPIHIEGRDEPVLPKAAPTFTNPQPERIFSQRPEQFTQFVNREPRHENWHRPGFDQMYQGFSPEELLRQQRYQQNVPPYYQQQQQQQQPPRHGHQQHVPQQQQPKEEIPIPVQREVPQTKQQVPPQQAAPPQQPPQPKPAPQQHKPKTPIDEIQAIQKDVSGLLVQVEQFAGKPKDKQYLYLDEMLTRNLLKLDNVDTQGQDSIRSARKEAIRCIEKAISVLEAKAVGNVQPSKSEETMDVEEKSRQEVTVVENATGEKNKAQIEVQTMETEPVSEGEPLSENKVQENQPQPMELPPENAPNQESLPIEEQKDEAEKESSEASQNDSVMKETRAVLVKEPAKAEDKPEAMDAREATPPVTGDELKQPEQTCEGQESNVPVAEAIKKFEGKENEKVENKSEETKGASEVQTENKKEETIKEEKKDKKKGKKKVEKKEK